MTKCRRCGATFTPIAKGQERCEPCAADLAALIASDAQRHVNRFARSKILDGGRAA